MSPSIKMFEEYVSVVKELLYFHAYAAGEVLNVWDKDNCQVLTRLSSSISEITSIQLKFVENTICF